MNDDHREALALYATRLAGAPKAEWRATGLDPEGLDLAAGDRTARVPFRIASPGRASCASVLKAMAEHGAGDGAVKPKLGHARSP